VRQYGTNPKRKRGNASDDIPYSSKIHRYSLSPRGRDPRQITRIIRAQMNILWVNNGARIFLRAGGTPTIPI